jgi:acetylornithine deacetylase/succinyl-diaminopimelate desuccinylase-like protein
MYQMLRGKNEGLSGDAISLASRLVAEKSVSLHEEAAATLVEKEMRSLGYDHVSRDGAGNIIGVMYGRNQNKTVLLTSHLDTVSPDEEDSWSSNPFSGEISDGRIHGIGSSDCKGGLAAQVYSAALLRRSMLPMDGNIVVAATVAEQNGLSLGTRYLLSESLPQLRLVPNFAVLGEPTDLGVYYGHDGWVEMEVKLEAANSFAMEDAVNVVAEELSNAYAGQASGSFELDKPRFRVSGEGHSATIGLRGKLYHSDRPEDLVGSMERRVLAAAKSTGHVAVSANLKTEELRFYTGRTAAAQYASKAWQTDPFHPFIRRACEALSAAGCDARPGRWMLRKPGMGTAGTVFLDEYKIPVIGYGPGREEMAHSADEWVETRKIAEAVFGNAVILHAMAGVPVCGWTLDEI